MQCYKTLCLPFFTDDTMDALEITPTRVKITSIIRNAILSGEFAAGSELSLTDMASRLGVSRTPVREAFQTLEAEGLIALRMNKGALVKPINEEFITDHFRIRRLLEGEAVFRAAENKIDTAALAELQKKAVDAGVELGGQAYEEYNQTFHAMLWKAAGGHKLQALLEALWNGPSYGKGENEASHRAASIKEHGQIVRDIAQGDAEKARSVMHHHIERSMDNILKSLSHKD